MNVKGSPLQIFSVGVAVDSLSSKIAASNGDNRFNSFVASSSSGDASSWLLGRPRRMASVVLAASLVVLTTGGCAARRATSVEPTSELTSGESASASAKSEQTLALESSADDKVSSGDESARSGARLEGATAQTLRSSLANKSAQSLGIEQISSTKGSSYELTGAEGLSAVDSFAVANPARFVVDLKGVTAISPTTLQVANDSAVSSIRIGKRGDGTRIVFDLKSDAEAHAPYVQKLADGGSIRVMFGSAPGSAPQLSSIERSESASQFNGSSGSTEVVSSSGKVEDSSLTALTFEKSPNDAGRVVLTLSEVPTFTLRKSSATEYVLTLKGSIANESAKSPQIAQPGNVEGLRVVRALQKGENIQLRMFVDAGTTLTASKTASGLEIAALPPAKGVGAASGRAQLAPAKDAAPPAESNKKSEVAASSNETASEPVKVVEGDDDAARRNPTGIPSADGSKSYTGRLISLDLQETDIDNALRIIAEVSNLNIIASDDVAGKVTLRLIDVPWDQALDVILKTNGLDQVTEGNVIRIAPVDKLKQEREALRDAKKAAENLEDLKVKYLRVSYARAADLKEQVETVLSERGSTTVDERTNQLIIKDIQKGQEEVLQLVKKLDLRTPQVLLETQIVEASRSLLRDLGFQWNFSYSMSPQTGNPTGLNFPNTIVAGGAASSTSGLQAVNFPASIQQNAGAAIAAILDSADGSRAVSMRLTALEQEGKVRVLSRPQVATVNNKEAEIKSVETVRVPLPDSGLSVATGQGASASGGGASAFQTFDVGITLRVTPQASPDYYVLLDVFANSSTFGNNPVQGIPSTLERQTTSTILVKSGQTFALGGVYRVNDRDAVDGLPFLKDIPVLGHLFRRTLMDKRDEELIFFITPHIVEGSFDPSLM